MRNNEQRDRKMSKENRYRFDLKQHVPITLTLKEWLAFAGRDVLPLDPKSNSRQHVFGNYFDYQQTQRSARKNLRKQLRVFFQIKK